MKKSESVLDSAGKFSLWLEDIRNAMKANGEMKVDCGECSVCCTSSYFIHISSHEKQTLRCIPKELQFEPIGAPKGNVLLGYRKDGSCPMYENGQCTIYECRPQTCRKYDCRILTAAGLVESENRPLINRKIAGWEFEFEDALSKKKFDAVRAASSFMEAYASFFPEHFVPSNSVQKAIMAIQVYELFLGDAEIPCENGNTDFVERRVKEVMDTVEAQSPNWSR
ncbi:MAG: YkgJ family cysteine cluster protein [Deltaproteobacteria bacterium]|nr:YkgJ family cysteine cluster protein [Deltaproteobacteria bacterium]